MNEQETDEKNNKRIIKKYPNRRLYDTSESKYVTLSDVRELVLSGVSFCVIDKKSGDDIIVNMDGGVGGSWKVETEPVNIHEVMYDMATKTGKTTTQLDPIGASENFQGGSEDLYG